MIPNISFNTSWEISYKPKYLEARSNNDLRSDAAAALHAVQKGEKPVVIKQRSRTAAVMISSGTYGRMVYVRGFLGVPAKGESEIRSAQGVSLTPC